MSRHSFAREGNRGSVLVAALALVFLIVSITMVALMRGASLYAQAGLRHKQASALFLAEAGVQKAARELSRSKAYAGERGTRLATGSFDVAVAPSERGYEVTSTGHADSAFERKPRQTVRAVLVIRADSFRIADWRENP
jgi:Tfp pilus assembly protein PilX